MKTFARFDEFPIAAYSINGLSILEVKFANSSPLSCQLYGTG